jgi:prepilin-type N-terminal cleavage/methylation domain-containing protein
MRPLRNRGFTLVEMVVVLGLMGIVIGALYQSIVATQRTTSAQFQRIDVQQTTRAAAMYVSNMLRELDATDGDILISQATSLRFRAMRWTGVLCTVPFEAAGQVQFTVRGQLLFGIRRPDAGLDSILLWRDGDPSIRTDDLWLYGGLQSSAAGVCPDDGSAGTTLRVVISAGSGGNGAAAAGMTLGAPVRGFQVEEISLYPQGAEYWLGRRTANRAAAWEVVRPLVGPLMDNGLAFSYFDINGAPPALTTQIASVGLTIRGRSARRVSGRGFLQDSIVTRVTLRNNARF